MNTIDDAVVANYLGWLNAAAQSLPADRRAELVDEISAHIAEARAQSAGSETDLIDLLTRLGDPEEIVLAAASDSPPGLAPGTGEPGFPADFPTVTNPVVIDSVAASAAAGAAAQAGVRPGTPSAGAGVGSASSAGWGEPVMATRAQAVVRPGALEIAAVILAVGAGLLLPFSVVLAAAAWAIGVGMLWYSPRWRASDKILGTLVWPVGAGLAILLARLPLVAPGLFRPFTGYLFGLYGPARLLVIVAVIATAAIIAARLLRRAGRAPA